MLGTVRNTGGLAEHLGFLEYIYIYIYIAGWFPNQQRHSPVERQDVHCVFPLV